MVRSGRGRGPRPDGRARAGRALKRDLTTERLGVAIRSSWATTAGPDRRRSVARLVEDFLIDLYGSAAGTDRRGVALAAVGSLARRELGPRSDIDLVLLHDGSDQAAIDTLAEKLWYPLWDSGLRLDHSVRTPAECAEVAHRELSAAVGLLDLRLIAGEPELVERARSGLLEAWRAGARRRLPELLESLSERHQRSGDAASLLEPDLKECRGGLRDMIMLRALAATWLTDQPHAGVREPYQRLLDVRDALQVVSGRALDRLVAGEVPDVAKLLGYGDEDELRRDISLAARKIGHAVDLTVRSARQVLPARRRFPFARRERRPQYDTAPHGLIVHLGEVGLARLTSPAEPLLGLRAGALAASRGLVLSPVTAENLGAHAPPLPTPWPDEAREALLELLAGGEATVAVWETLDLAGCISRWIPSWEGIRARPQHNPVHRHTVDRHSVQAVAEAARHLTSVERPDLLLLGCLFHDIGKLPGAEHDHPRVGAPIARQAVTDMGYGEEDAALVELLVREHLTLAELATKRDHADPATMDALVKAVDGRIEVLRLLRALTEADARAAGPAAWSPWRAQLINALTERAEDQLAGEPHTGRAGGLIDLGLARSVALDGRSRIIVEEKPAGLQVIIATRDRLGLFGDTAGLLAAHGIAIRSALLSTIDGIAVNTWRVESAGATDLPDPAYLIKQLERLGRGEPGVLEAIRRREERVQNAGAEPWVAVVPDASESASVIEIRANDRRGLLYAYGRALTGVELSIRSAHIATLAGQAIDTFYLTERDGAVPTPARAAEAARVLGDAARGGKSD
ncbi:[protein-PII] uridylyltransferase [Microlunatus sp. GCM10028923]|uniref:[protein-PII] uridylyltransferase n=1 Tax=Microlunatus sp. GCM10028923 TaxID=3273400 RepID=UPI003618A43F